MVDVLGGLFVFGLWVDRGVNSVLAAGGGGARMAWSGAPSLMGLFERAETRERDEEEAPDRAGWGRLLELGPGSAGPTSGGEEQGLELAGLGAGGPREQQPGLVPLEGVFSNVAEGGHVVVNSGTRFSRRLAAKDASPILGKAVALKSRREDLEGRVGGRRAYPSRKKTKNRSAKCGVLLDDGEMNSLMEFISHKV